MRAVDAVLGPLDEWMASRMIARWREDVWTTAVQLLASNDFDERQALMGQVEADALRRAQGILIGRDPLAPR
jgi:hypothetical protein